MIGVAGVAGTGGQQLALSAAVLLVVVVGERFDRTTCPAGGVIAVLGLALGAGVAAVWSVEAVHSVVSSGELVLLAVFLGVGWFDPRFAVAATLLCGFRFLTADVGELASALEAAATRDQFRLALARWTVMGSGMAASWWLTRAALDRCLTIHR